MRLNSFTSIFDVRFPLAILGTVIFAFGLSAWISIPANPEVKFWTKVREIRDEEISKSRETIPGAAMIFFTGGSSCAFSIDPEIVEDACGMPAFNLGLPASAGPHFLLHQALSRCQKDDIIVVCLEPDFLTDSSILGEGPMQLSFALASMEGVAKEAGGGDTFKKCVSTKDVLNFSRPGARFVATLIGKTITGKGYRYTMGDLRYRGRIETSISDPHQPAGVMERDSLSSRGIEFLREFREAASNRGVSTVYSMPWHFTLPEFVGQNREKRAKMLEEISRLMPVLPDPAFGVSDDPANFSDSGLHLTARGSSLRSKVVASSLKEWLESKGGQMSEKSPIKEEVPSPEEN